MPIDIDRDRFVTLMREQSRIGDAEDGGLNRLTLTDADRAVRDWFRSQAEAAGLNVRVDEMGNQFATRSGSDPNAGTVLIGSHLDSQPNGGIYDGALGVVAALEFVKTLEDEGIDTRRPVEVVNWTNEEGSRFQPAMMASGVWAGAHDRDEMYARTDSQGNRFVDELERIDARGDVPATPQRDYDSYLELHIEQGPRLEEAGADVGVVTGVVGFQWWEVTLTGEANHSGTTPMHHRHDALVGAADVVTAVRRIPGTLGERTVGTSGIIRANPGSINIIPGKVTVTCGFRDPDDTVVDEAINRMRSEVDAAADREGLDYTLDRRMAVGSVDFAPRVVETVAASADDLGLDALRLTSGAGHDASHVADVCDAAMVFAVSEDGRSHSPNEYTSWSDCYAAANTFANAALDLADPVGADGPEVSGGD